MAALGTRTKLWICNPKESHQIFFRTNGVLASKNTHKTPPRTIFKGGGVETPHGIGFLRNPPLSPPPPPPFLKLPWPHQRQPPRPNHQKAPITPHPHPTRVHLLHSLLLARQTCPCVRVNDVNSPFLGGERGLWLPSQILSLHVYYIPTVSTIRRPLLLGAESVYRQQDYRPPCPCALHASSPNPAPTPPPLPHAPRWRQPAPPPPPPRCGAPRQRQPPAVRLVKQGTWIQWKYAQKSGDISAWLLRSLLLPEQANHPNSPTRFKKGTSPHTPQ